jgi:peptidoglycan/xylan/chitin deacetylase (PgdA/CDA1 family)
MLGKNLLCYHKITDRLDVGINTRTIRDFTADTALVTALPDDGRPEICFDDGYDDTYRHAFPILTEAKLTANLFVITALLGKKNSWDFNYFGAFEHITLAEVKELSAAGWRIGSHSQVHLALTTLNNKTLRDELLGSRLFLEDALGKTIDTISFPFGNFNERVIAMCKETGYTSAVSIKKKSDDGFVRRGKAVYRFDSAAQIRSKLSNAPLELARLRAINALSALTVLKHRLQGYAPQASS